MKFIVNYNVDPAETDFRSVQHVMSIIRTFLAVFTDRDSCALEIRTDDTSLGNFSLHGVFNECLEQERHLHKASGIVRIVTPTPEAIQHNDDDIILPPSAPVSADDLFRMYRNSDSRLATAYEEEHVSDLYDADMIAFATTNGNGFGSSTPEQARPAVTYITRPDNNVTSVLDVGCGAGRIYEQLSRHCLITGHAMPHYVGLDYSRSQIERARRKYPRAFFSYGDATELPFPDNSFDIVVASSVLGFMPIERAIKGLSEVLRIGRKGALTELTCTSRTHPLTGRGTFEKFRWSSRYSVVTSHPPIEDVLAVAQSSNKVDVTQKEHIHVHTQAGHQTTVPEASEQFAVFNQFLEQSIQSLLPKHGSVDRIPRDEIDSLMLRGGQVELASGAKHRIDPGMIWDRYVQATIQPKGWRWAPVTRLDDRYTKVQVFDFS